MASRKSQKSGIPPRQRDAGGRRAGMPRGVSASGGRQWSADRAERAGAMIEGFDPSSLVIVNLVNPKEKFFGVLSALSPAGITVRAINLESFEDWMRQLARGDDPNLDLITMFVPLFRVERIFLDEPSGAIKSFGQRFEEVVGMTIQQYLDLQYPDFILSVGGSKGGERSIYGGAAGRLRRAKPAVKTRRCEKLHLFSTGSRG